MRYQKKLDKIHVEQEKAKAYLNTAVPLYELLKEKMDQVISDDTALSLPKTL